MRLTVHFQE